MSEKIVEAVKQAIERQIGDDGIVMQDGYSVKVDTWLDLDAIARAAIEAYEAAKREAAEPYVMRVEKGVTYWSNGLCSQETPDYMKHETSVVTMPDGVQYKATWSDFDKVGGPTLKIDKQP